MARYFPFCTSFLLGIFIWTWASVVLGIPAPQDTTQESIPSSASPTPSKSPTAAPSSGSIESTTASNTLYCLRISPLIVVRLFLSLYSVRYHSQGSCIVVIEENIDFAATKTSGNTTTRHFPGKSPAVYTSFLSTSLFLLIQKQDMLCALIPR